MIRRRKPLSRSVGRRGSKSPNTTANRGSRKPRSGSASAHPNLKFAKSAGDSDSTRTTSSRKRDRAKHRSAVIASVRAAVWNRDHACRITGIARDDDEMHEIVPRSKLRGRPPEEIFNTRNCIRLSRAIHRHVTEHKVILIYGDHGADGPVHAQERTTWKTNTPRQ